jgi:hypothetical protein
MRFLLGLAIGLIIAGFVMIAQGHAQVPAAPPKAPIVVHRAATPPPKVVYVYPPTPYPGWGLGSWIAAPFSAVGSVIGAVGAGVTNVVEAPFIAVGNSWDANNCWRNMVDQRTGETKLYWICR